MQAAARLNPLAHVVDAKRALFAGEVGASAVLAGWVAALATAAVGLTLGIRAMMRSAD